MNGRWTEQGLELSHRISIGLAAVAVLLVGARRPLRRAAWQFHALMLDLSDRASPDVTWLADDLRDRAS